MTTPKAILDAASRLRRFKALDSVTRHGVEDIYDPEADDFPQCVARDEALVAAWALGWLREDDGEAVTEEWLASLGWIDPPATWNHPLRADVVVRFGRHGPCTGDDSIILYFAGSTVAVSPTRGHVRALLRGLGVETRG